MDFVRELLQMIHDAYTLARSGSRVDLDYDIEQRYLTLGPDERRQFRAAVVELLSHPDADVRLDMVVTCFRLKITEARSALVNMLRDEGFVSKHGANVAAALDPEGAREAGVLLSRIIQRYWNSPSVSSRRNPVCEASLCALARGNPIAVVPYLRPLFDDEMKHGFKSWPAGPNLYKGGTVSDLVRSVIVHYGIDGVQLVREVFKGIPTEQEAYLRVELKSALERCREQDWYDERPPEVPDEVIENLQKYIDSLSPTIQYVPPALPERCADEK